MADKYSLENITIEKIVFGGKGFARHSDGRVIFITGGAIPQSIVNLKILKNKKDFIEAQITEVVKKSPLETGSYKEATGAPWINIDYKEQLSIKQNQLEEALFHLKKYTPEINLLPIIASPIIYGYRNKIEFSFGKYISAREGREEHFNVGFHARGQFDRIEDYDDCILIDKEQNNLYREIKSWSKNSGYPVYDNKTQEGFFRHIVIRKMHFSKETMLILGIHHAKDTASKEYLDVKNFLLSLTKKYTFLTSIYISHNTHKADIALGDLEHMYGKETITELLNGIHFQIGPKSFFQTNSSGAEVLYTTAINTVDKDTIKDSNILDLYAGTGTIGMFFAQHVKKVYSIELVQEASQDGEKNALSNGIQNMEFIADKVESFLKKFLDEGKSAQVLIVDPPRSGMHPDALPNIIKFDAHQIVYVSCNPATLVRDLEYIIKNSSYRIESIQGVDMFPHTHHIEVVCSLKKSEI